MDFLAGMFKGTSLSRQEVTEMLMSLQRGANRSEILIIGVANIRRVWPLDGFPCRKGVLCTRRVAAVSIHSLRRWTARECAKDWQRGGIKHGQLQSFDCTGSAGAGDSGCSPRVNLSLVADPKATQTYCVADQ